MAPPISPTTPFSRLGRKDLPDVGMMIQNAYDLRSLLPHRWCFAPLLLLCLPAVLPAEEPQSTGEAVYKRQCASCHGDQGQGAKAFKDPLTGEMSLADLAEYIDEMMPEETPEDCQGEDAQKVAAYIFDAFYSPIAQARVRPPRIELVRLTERQYRHSAADLLAAFLGSGKHDQERGLEATFHNSERRIRDDRKVAQRRDAAIAFDFGEEGPQVEKVDPKEYSIRWSGSLLAPESGDFELIVYTKNGIRLWVNHPEEPVIDQPLRSGEEATHRTVVRLLAGRAFSIRLEFYKSKYDKNGAISLKWKRPGGVEEVIPNRFLSPHRSPEVLTLQTEFPPDDSSQGYQRGNSVSAEWEQATSSAAFETAHFISARLRDLSGYRRGDGSTEPKVRDFCRRFVEQAFRRPLSEDEQQFFIQRQFEAADTVEAAVLRVVVLTLKSPRFLYLELEGPAPDSFTAAARISYALYDGLPDEALWQAAAKGELRTREQIAEHARRLLADPRSQAKLLEFFHQWLMLSGREEISKSSERYPDFNQQSVADLRHSLDLFLQELIADSQADIRRLFSEEKIYLNGPLAKLYGADLPEDADFQSVGRSQAAEAGVLTHPLLLAGLAYHEESSPIHRGVFLVRNVLGTPLRPPPDAVTPLPPELHPDLTTRERTALQTRGENCQGCHIKIDPLGFSLEHYDAIGRFRDREKEKLINAQGRYKQASGEEVAFNGANELASFLAGSPEFHQAFVEKLFQFMVKQPLQGLGKEEAEALQKSLPEKNYRLHDLLIEITTTYAMYTK